MEEFMNKEEIEGRLKELEETIRSKSGYVDYCGIALDALYALDYCGITLDALYGVDMFEAIEIVEEVQEAYRKDFEKDLMNFRLLKDKLKEEDNV